MNDQMALDQAERGMRDAITAADNAVEKYNDQSGLESGTTISAIRFYETNEGETRLIIGNVADSRVYLIREGGITPLTLDHLTNPDYEQEAFETQKKLSESEDSAELHGRNLISQAAGDGDVRPYISDIEIKSGDRIMVSSDGIHDNLRDSEINHIVKDAKSAKDAKLDLFEAARKRAAEGKGVNARAKDDDMSIVVVFVSLASEKLST
jgi:protein phosphatase